MKAVTFFSGMGGACAGLERAGFQVVWGNECWDYAAQVWKLNHPKAVMMTYDIRELDLNVIPFADLFWFSPPCPEFSTAKYNRSGGTDFEDTSLADKIHQIIAAKQPQHILIENVPGYIESFSFKIIRDALTANGYHYKICVVQMQEIIPQTRVRMIVYACKESKKVDFLNLQPAQLSPTWYDLLYTGVDDLGFKYKGCTLPRNKYPRAVSKVCIIQRIGCSSALKNIREKGIDQPIGTLTASMGCDGNGYFRSPYSIVEPDGTTYSLKIPALLAVAGMYDGHRLGDRPGLNARMIGNGVPSVYAEWLGNQLKK